MTSAHNLDSAPGTPTHYRIGKYRIRARLGKGGMGIVYLGRDEALDRDVAIKTLRVEGSPDEESRGRFEIEAKAAARLQHSNIVTVYELGEDRGLPFIAMELLDGQDLETLLRSGERLSTAERLDVVIQTLRGLDFAHAHHIIHRDMKPSNIRVLDDGGVKILDFGIAKVESTSMTRAGMMVGTPYYMSPEHIRGSVLDGRSDVFALGVILHEMFASKRPFTAEDPTRIMFRIVNDPHPRLHADAAGPFTGEVQQIIDRALEKDADARFGSASQMADQVSRVRERFSAPHLKSEDTATLVRARRVTAAGAADPNLIKSVEGIARAHPEVVEAQRLVRVFKRKPAESPGTAETATFPELDATFGRARSGGAETLRSGDPMSGRAETVGREAPLPPAAPSRPSNSLLYAGMAAAILAGIVASLVYVSRAGITDGATSGSTVSSPSAEGSTTTPPAERPVSPATVRAAATKPEPPTRKAAATGLEAATSKTAATTARPAASPPLPEVRPRTERAVVRLERSATPAILVVESGYPVTVSASGRVLATDQAGATFTLSAGAHDIVIESAAFSLRQRETVQLEAGSPITLRTPSTGKIGVRASPDNCKVFIDGAFVDYPPILDRPIVAGSHLVTFEWPDGVRAEQRIQVLSGKPSYVMGRKP